MSRKKSDSSNKIVDTCIFCLIAHDQDKEAEVVKKNKELVCFRDIYPAAPHHYLVVPIRHIHSCYSLHRGHISLVERMVEMGKAALHDQGITDMNNIRLGFHLPPYTSVDHLHLHVLAPVSQISEYLAFKFIPGTDRFVTEECLRKHLKDNAPSASCSVSVSWQLPTCTVDHCREATNNSRESFEPDASKSKTLRLWCSPCKK